MGRSAHPLLVGRWKRGGLMGLNKEVRLWVEGIDETSLKCRDLHHSWNHYTAGRKGRGYERTLVCKGCDTLKVQSLSSRGMILKTKYQYIEGYLRPKGLGRVTKEENALIRLQSIIKVVES